jgi:hypothetical protein
VTYTQTRQRRPWPEFGVYTGTSFGRRLWWFNGTANVRPEVVQQFLRN